MTEKQLKDMELHELKPLPGPEKILIHRVPGGWNYIYIIRQLIAGKQVPVNLAVIFISEPAREKEPQKEKVRRIGYLCRSCGETYNNNPVECKKCGGVQFDLVKIKR
jgi:predicted Zn-ribbon and HTH transcriptional regulator